MHSFRLDKAQVAVSSNYSKHSPLFFFISVERHSFCTVQSQVTAVNVYFKHQSRNKLLQQQNKACFISLEWKAHNFNGNSTSSTWIATAFLILKWFYCRFEFSNLDVSKRDNFLKESGSVDQNFDKLDPKTIEYVDYLPNLVITWMFFFGIHCFQNTAQP